MENDNEETPDGDYIDEHNETLVEFGKNALIGSLNAINEFIKLMIPLTTGLITAYFALLEFIDAKEVAKSNSIDILTLIEPTYFMLVSLIAFIITIFPILKTLTIGNINSIRSFRNTLIAWRYIGAGLGASLFLIGVFKMITVVNSILQFA